MPRQIGDIKFYNLTELSEALQVTPTSLRTYIHKGKLRGRKVGNKWYVTEEKLKEFLSGITYKSEPDTTSSF
ncbi:MAG TPA: helix-turn-helix domain-containing protein [Candidatus Eremiobacteraeota bacterium]|nr:MAG: Helix-turn-helix domain protein [bacterium ADurb.Bin363]HPZ06492.1 helix-turn-helix domain-containing protein [Candidatus Eremiobacteraeota bacterium]